MPYRFKSFDGVQLPDHNPVDDLSTGQVPPSLADTFNGALDFWGATRRLPRSQQITFRGTYVAQKGVITDHLGRVLIEPGRATIAAQGTNPAIPGHDQNWAALSTDLFFADLRVKVDILKGKLGYLAKLRRQPEDERRRAVLANEAVKANMRAIIKANPPDLDTQIKAEMAKLVDVDAVGLQWKLARLMSVKHERELGNIDRVANVEVEFQTVMSSWKSEALATYPASGYGTVTGQADIEITVNGSEVVNDFVVKLVPLSPVSRLAITANGATISWNDPGDFEKTGAAALSAPIASAITIDMGKETITGGGDDLYANFNINTSAPGWLYLAPGVNQVRIEAPGASANYLIEYNSQWI